MDLSLGDALPIQIERVRGIISMYESVPNGIFAATMMKKDIERAQKAIMEGDIAQMFISYKELASWKEE